MGLGALVVAFTSAVTAAVAADLGTLRLGVLQFGTVNWELDVIRHHGLDAKEGFIPEVQGFAAGNASNIALMGGAVDGIVPLPRWFLLTSKLTAGVLVAIAQVYVFLAIAWLWQVRPPAAGYLMILPALVLAGLMLSALGLLLSSLIRQLENFAGVMNFVILPMFFAASALYPLWRMQESSIVCIRSAPPIRSPTRSS